MKFVSFSVKSTRDTKRTSTTTAMTGQIADWNYLRGYLDAVDGKQPKLHYHKDLAELAKCAQDEEQTPVVADG